MLAEKEAFNTLRSCIYPYKTQGENLAHINWVRARSLGTVAKMVIYQAGRRPRQLRHFEGGKNSVCGFLGFMEMQSDTSNPA